MQPLATSKKLLVIMPVYNEQATIKQVISDWMAILNRENIDFEFQVYNDGSIDQSGTIIQSLMSKHSQLRYIEKANSGHGPTVLSGYKSSTQAQWILQIDSDNEIKATDFPLFWENRNQYDFIIGLRQNRLSPMARKFVSTIARWAIKITFGSNIYDVNCPFRLFKSTVFSAEIKLMPENTFAPNVILSGIACNKNLKILNIPITYEYRKTGIVSINKWKLLLAAVKSFWQTIYFRLHLLPKNQSTIISDM